MEALLELAAAFLYAGYHDQSDMRFRNATNRAEWIFGFDDERTVWILISIGSVYQT